MKKLTKKIIEKNKELLQESMDVLLNLEAPYDSARGAIHTHTHILYALKEIMGEKCKTYLEIGVFQGMSMILTMQSKYPTKFYGIDNFSHPMSSADRTMDRLTKFNPHKHYTELIQGDSTEKITIEYVKENLKEGIDLFFIDGEHDDETPYKDMVNYFPFINEGGIIVMDDYTSTPNIIYWMDKFIEEYKSEINVIGVIDNFVNAKGAGGSISEGKWKDKNMEFIIQKIK
jgi:predicted O-methyltransferase YrrM